MQWNRWATIFLTAAATALGGGTCGGRNASPDPAGADEAIVSFSVEAGLLNATLDAGIVRPVDAVDLGDGDLVFSAFPDTILEDIDAFHLLPDDEGVVFSTSTDVTQGFGGITSIKNGDLVLWDGTTATLLFSELIGFGDAHNNIDAFSILPNGKWLLSTDLDAILGGSRFQDGDIIEYDPVADLAALYEGLDEATIFSGTPNSNPDIDALHVRANGNVIFSIRSEGIGRVGNGPSYEFADAPRTDLFELDPANLDASLFLDGDGIFDGVARNIDAVALPEGSRPVELRLLGSSSEQGTDPSSLFEVDMNTGVARYIGTPAATSAGLSDVASDPTTGRLYAIHGAATRGAELLELDPATAAVISRVTIRSVPLVRGSDALAFDSTGRLYVGAWQLGRLMEVNPETGVALSDVSVTGGGETNHLSDLAIDPTTGEVWASRGNNFPGRLVEIDPATGAVITILDLEEPLPRVTAIAFDSDGQLFASFDGNQLARVDLRTGSWSPIGTGFGGPKIAGLGFER